MDFRLVDPIARAILYEGYSLYPYRTSSLKNCRPSAFGSLCPKADSLANGGVEPWSMQSECLVRGDAQTTLQGAVRFLQFGGSDVRDVLEREVALSPRAVGDLAIQSARINFTFAGEKSSLVEGCVELSVEVANDSVFKIRIRIANETPYERADQPVGVGLTMHSTHAILGASDGRFLSLIDPPGDVRGLAETCRNRGAWPVLVGDSDRHDMILAAPIILYDFPQIAPESPGNLFDGTEIDELLTLRILTLTESEKQAIKSDKRTRAILERTEKLTSDQLLALHGAIREIRFTSEAQRRFQSGDHVRLRPSALARSASSPHQDIFDLALEGKPAVIASIEQDFEGRVYYSVVLDDDPGRDLGRDGKPGHRFFFRCEEIELLSGDG